MRPFSHKQAMTSDARGERLSKVARISESCETSKLQAVLEAWSVPFWHGVSIQRTVKKVWARSVRMKDYRHGERHLRFIATLGFEYQDGATLRDENSNDLLAPENEDMAVEEHDVNEDEHIVDVTFVKYCCRRSDLLHPDSVGDDVFVNNEGDVLVHRLVGLKMILSSGRCLMLSASAISFQSLVDTDYFVVSNVQAHNDHAIVAIQARDAQGDRDPSGMNYFDKQIDCDIDGGNELRMFSRGIVEQPVDGLDIVVQLLKDLDFHNVAVRQVLLHTRNDWRGGTVAHIACFMNWQHILAKLGEADLAELFTIRDRRGEPPLVVAVEDLSGDQDVMDCLRTVAQFAGKKALMDTDYEGDTLAHLAVQNGWPDMLRLLASLGATCLFSVANGHVTPAHVAAERNDLECLIALHECLRDELGPLVQVCKSRVSQAEGMVGKYKQETTLSYESSLEAAVRDAEIAVKLMVCAGTEHIGPGRTPAGLTSCARCLDFLNGIGGLATLRSDLARDPSLLLDWQMHGRGNLKNATLLLSQPRYLDLASKAAWLARSLDAATLEAGREQGGLVIAVNWDHPLEGACVTLGVDESTAALTTARLAPLPRVLNIENGQGGAEGDGLRRQWLNRAAEEIMDPDHGLFKLMDDRRTLAPNPKSALIGGADHLVQFTLLGQIFGLALLHKEQIARAAELNLACVRLLLGLKLTEDDLAALDPTSFAKRVRYLRELPKDASIEDLCITFSATEEPLPDYLIDDSAPKTTSPDIDLKPDGVTMDVTRETLDEYIDLWCAHKLRCWQMTTSLQFKALSVGFRVYVSENLATRVQRCIEPSEFLLLLGGLPEVGDKQIAQWRQHTRYEGGASASMPLVSWFWEVVHAFSHEERAKLLAFTTGSPRPPAVGFERLSGFNGSFCPFTICLATSRDGQRLPTASTCFNKLFLPRYANAAELKTKLLNVISCSTFDEGAVAEA